MGSGEARKKVPPGVGSPPNSPWASRSLFTPTHSAGRRRADRVQDCEFIEEKRCAAARDRPLDDVWAARTAYGETLVGRMALVRTGRPDPAAVSARARGGARHCVLWQVHPVDDRGLFFGRGLRAGWAIAPPPESPPRGLHSRLYSARAPNPCQLGFYMLMHQAMQLVYIASGNATTGRRLLSVSRASKLLSLTAHNKVARREAIIGESPETVRP